MISRLFCILTYFQKIVLRNIFFVNDSFAFKFSLIGGESDLFSFKKRE
jgi:hypothetical protein